jgi:hypothetical protein
MTPTSTAPRFVEWVLYPASVIVALMSSAAAAFLFTLLEMLISLMFSFIFKFDPTAIINFIAYLFIGFSGVFFGSLCHRSSKRFFVSLLLLVIGLGFYCFIEVRWIVMTGQSFRLGQFLCMAIGGAMAVGLFRWRRSNNSPEPTPLTLAVPHSRADTHLRRGSALDR